MSKTNQYGSCLSSDAQLTDKPHELGLGDNVEVCDEKEKNGFEGSKLVVTSA